MSGKLESWYKVGSRAARFSLGKMYVYELAYGRFKGWCKAGVGIGMEPARLRISKMYVYGLVKGRFRAGLV